MQLRACACRVLCCTAVLGSACCCAAWSCCSLLIGPAHRLKQSSIFLPELMQLALQRCCVGGHVFLLLLLCRFYARPANSAGQSRLRLGALDVRWHVRKTMSVSSASKHTFQQENHTPDTLVTKRLQCATLRPERDKFAPTRSLRFVLTYQGKVTQTTARR
jgi:hypothetical protein